MSVLFLTATAAADLPPIARTTIVAAPGALVDVGARAGAGQLAEIRARVETAAGVPIGLPVAPFAEAPIAGSDAADYIARLKVPEMVGDYVVVWSDPEGQEADEPLLVKGWRPTIADVAALCAAYTREHVGGYKRPTGDRAQAGRERGVFTPDTDPTAEQVERYIDAARDEVLGRVGVGEIPVRCYGLARVTAMWHAAGSVEAKRRPSQSDDASGLYRSFMSNYRNSLDELIPQARWAPLRLS